MSICKSTTTRWNCYSVTDGYYCEDSFKHFLNHEIFFDFCRCFKREFTEAVAIRIWEACWANYFTDYFHLFVCLAIISAYADDVIAQDLRTDEMLLHFSSLGLKTKHFPRFELNLFRHIDFHSNVYGWTINSEESSWLVTPVPTVSQDSLHPYESLPSMWAWNLGFRPSPCSGVHRS